MPHQSEVESNRVPRLIFCKMRELNSRLILFSVFLLLTLLCLFLSLGFVLFVGLAWIVIGPLVEGPFAASPPYRCTHDFGRPGGRVSVEICADTWEIAAADCPTLRSEVFTATTEPVVELDLHGPHPPGESVGDRP